MATYYMYHGGTNFGRSAGGPNIVTSYDYDVALDEYGLLHEPKYSHLKHLHSFLHAHQATILGNPEASAQSLGTNLEAHVYGTLGNSDCVAFLSNIGTSDASGVKFNNNVYSIPAWSVSILTSCSTVVFNTAQLVPPAGTEVDVEQHELARVSSAGPSSGSGDINSNSWTWWPDVVGGQGWATPIIAAKPLEQTTTTHDTTDFLWYETSYFSSAPGSTTLRLTQTYDFVHAFLNGQYLGSSSSSSPSFTCDLKQGINNISLLVETMGLVNYGTFLEQDRRGLLGTVTLAGSDITSASSWNHTVGLRGEQLQVWTATGSAQVSWSKTGADFWAQ